jgi:spore germination protein GerM
VRIATRRAGLVLVVASLAATGACGISSSDHPETIAAENLPPGLLDPNPGTSTTLADSPATTSVPVYFLVRTGDEERLAAVDREVQDVDSAGERLRVLFSQPTAEENDSGITSAVPTDLVLLAEPELDPETGVLTVDLSSELFSVQAAELTRAVAQLVYTVTDVEGVSLVRFLVDGEPTPVPDDESVEKAGPVGRANYRALAPGP